MVHTRTITVDGKPLKSKAQEMGEAIGGCGCALMVLAVVIPLVIWLWRSALG